MKTESLFMQGFNHLERLKSVIVFVYLEGSYHDAWDWPAGMKLRILPNPFLVKCSLNKSAGPSLSERKCYVVFATLFCKTGASDKNSNPYGIASAKLCNAKLAVGGMSERGHYNKSQHHTKSPHKLQSTFQNL